jgi:hypothetical protein
MLFNQLRASMKKLFSKKFFDKEASNKHMRIAIRDCHISSIARSSCCHAASPRWRFE